MTTISATSPCALHHAGPLTAPDAARRTAARQRRIVLLLIATLIMGVFDLIYTMTYMQSVGMVEVNPLARWMIELGGPNQLILFKAATMWLSAGTLFLCRRHPVAELWTWACCVVMLALMAHWVAYNHAVVGMTHEIVVLATSAEAPDFWVRFSV